MKDTVTTINWPNPIKPDSTVAVPISTAMLLTVFDMYKPKKGVKTLTSLWDSIAENQFGLANPKEYRLLKHDQLKTEAGENIPGKTGADAWEILNVLLREYKNVPEVKDIVSDWNPETGYSFIIRATLPFEVPESLRGMETSFAGYEILISEVTE